MAEQQAPGLWHTDLQRQDLSVPGPEMVQSRVDIGPEAPLVKHTHPGEEIIYILEGSLEHQIEGLRRQVDLTRDAASATAVGGSMIAGIGSIAAFVMAAVWPRIVPLSRSSRGVP